MRNVRTYVTVIVCSILAGAATGIAIFVYSMRSVEQTYANKLRDIQMTYKYLGKYQCWGAVFKTTAYTSAADECNKDKTHKYHRITYSGYKAVSGRTVAVDPKVVKLGSILIDLTDDQVYIAEDTGNLVRGYHVDIYMGEGTPENKNKVQQFGVQMRRFLVIEGGKI